MISNNRKGFTLVELLVVVGMIAVLMGAMTSAVHKARERARMQKAMSDVKVISQAILAYEIWNGDELPTMGARGKAANGVDATSANLGFLLGKGSAKGASGGSGSDELPVLLQASLQGNGMLRDPWGTPYKVTISESAKPIDPKVIRGSIWAGYWLPNAYREWED